MSLIIGSSCRLRLRKKSINIFSQLGRSPSMALFKSKVHNDQIDPTFNYPDFLRQKGEIETGDTTNRRSSGWCLRWSFTREDREHAGEDQAFWLKGSKCVQRMKVPAPSQHSAVIGPLDGPQSLFKSQRATLYETVN